jgi:hypothetical protein
MYVNKVKTGIKVFHTRNGFTTFVRNTFCSKYFLFDSRSTFLLQAIWTYIHTYSKNSPFYVLKEGQFHSDVIRTKLVRTKS